MSLLDRLRSMVKDMTEEERREFLEDVNSVTPEVEEEVEEEVVEEIEEEEQPEEVIELPDEIACSQEELQEILQIRTQLFQLKNSFADLCISFEDKKLEILKNITLTEELLDATAEKIKQENIKDQEVRQQYTLQLNFQPEPQAKLVKN